MLPRRAAAVGSRAAPTLDAWWTRRATACPPGAKLRGTPPPRGRVVRCEKPDGTLHGRWVVWYENGRIAEQGAFEDGKLVGHWVGWYDNGAKAREGAFDADQPHGTWMGWYEDGARKYAGELQKGYADGIWTFWKHDGELEHTEEYDNGLRLGATDVAGESGAEAESEAGTESEPKPAVDLARARTVLGENACVHDPVDEEASADKPADTTERIVWTVKVEDGAERVLGDLRALAEGAGCTIPYANDSALIVQCDDGMLEVGNVGPIVTFRVTEMADDECRALVNSLVGAK